MGGIKRLKRCRHPPHPAEAYRSKRRLASYHFVNSVMLKDMVPTSLLMADTR
jgi:hypothetical protein